MASSDFQKFNVVGHPDAAIAAKFLTPLADERLDRAKTEAFEALADSMFGAATRSPMTAVETLTLIEELQALRAAKQ